VLLLNLCEHGVKLNRSSMFVFSLRRPKTKTCLKWPLFVPRRIRHAQIIGCRRGPVNLLLFLITKRLPLVTVKRPLNLGISF
jgi:hypothetical protein